jgi:CSLREA domain-containing protein
MLIATKLRSWVAASVHRSGHRRRGERRALERHVPNVRLLGRIESLEPRTVLSTITVTSLADNTTNDGLITLREAILAANNDSVADATEGSQAGSGADTIVFDAALTAGGPATITLAGTELVIGSAVTIIGPGRELLTIDAQRSSRIFRIDDGDGGSSQAVQISGLTVTNGFGTDGDDGVTTEADNGGAIANFESLTLTDVAVTNSEARAGGGGVYNAGTLILNSSLVRANTSSGSGGGDRERGGRHGHGHTNDD